MIRSECDSLSLSLSRSRSLSYSPGSLSLFRSFSPVALLPTVSVSLTSPRPSASFVRSSFSRPVVETKARTFRPIVIDPPLIDLRSERREEEEEEAHSLIAPAMTTLLLRARQPVNQPAPPLAGLKIFTRLRDVSRRVSRAEPRCCSYLAGT